MYEKPEIKKWLEPHEGLFKYMSKHTGTNITTPEDVFNLDNLFQTLVSATLKKKIFMILRLSHKKQVNYILVNFSLTSTLIHRSGPKMLCPK